MKKLFLITMAFFAMTVFVGCSKDDDAPKINPELIVGKWQYVREVGYSSKNGVKSDEIDENHTADNRFLVFNADGTASVIENGREYKFYYKIEGNIYSDRESPNDPWENDSDHPSVRTIQTLTDSQLVIHDFREYTEEGNKYIDSYTSYYIRK